MSEVNLNVFINKVKELTNIDELDAVKDDPSLFEELAEKVGKLPPAVISLAVKEALKNSCGENVQKPADTLYVMSEMATCDRTTGLWNYCENPNTKALQARALKAVRNLLLFRGNEEEMKRILDELDYPELILVAYLYYVLKNVSIP